MGVAVIDRYTYYNLEFLEKNVEPSSKHTLKDLFDSYDNAKIHSTPGVRTDLFKRDLKDVLITEFFGNVQNVEVDGDGMRIEEDLLALGQLAGNYTSRRLTADSPLKSLAGSNVGASLKSTGAVRVEEDNENTWSRQSYSLLAVSLCIAIWFLSGLKR